MTKRAAKVSLVVMLTALVAGCKLAVIVVEGGEVQSSQSGPCLAGTVCLHPVSDSDYGQVFTAVPDAGWAFVNWRSGDHFFCGDSTDPVCTLSTAGYEGNAILEAIIASDETFYLMPVFKQTSGYPPVVGGNKEWLQPSDFTEYTPTQVEAVCPPPSGLCTGSLPDSNIDLTGYYWASLQDIAELLDAMRVLGRPVSGPDLVDPMADPVTPDTELLIVDEAVFFEYFTPTYTFFEGGPQRVLGAISRDQSPTSQNYEGIVIQYGFIQDGDWRIGSWGVSGAWFWRPLE